MEVGPGLSSFGPSSVPLFTNGVQGVFAKVCYEGSYPSLCGSCVDPASADMMQSFPARAQTAQGGAVRRIALISVVVLAMGLLLNGDRLLTHNPQAEAQTTNRPNIVFVMTDDLDMRSMQHLPGIREVMGSTGTSFDNAYVTYSLCCPSRATMLRGQYPHNHEIIGNGLPEGGEAKFRNLGRDRSTIATWLDGAGYKTKYIGKYMNNYNDLYVPPGWDEWYVMMGSHWTLSDPTTGKMNNNGQQTTLGGHSSDVFANKASDFIRRSSVNPAPFFMVVGTKAPHAPPEVATRHQDSFVDTPLPDNPNFDEPDVSDKPEWVRSYSRLSQTEIDDMHNPVSGAATLDALRGGSAGADHIHASRDWRAREHLHLLHLRQRLSPRRAPAQSYFGGG